MYEFLEAHAGCRWIAPDIEIIPANRDFAVPPLKTRGRPGSSHTFSIYQKDWTDVKPEFFAMMEDGKRASRPDGPLGHDFCLTNAELRKTSEC